MRSPIRFDEIELQIKDRKTDSTTPTELVSQPLPAGASSMRFYRHAVMSSKLNRVLSTVGKDDVGPARNLHPRPIKTGKPEINRQARSRESAFRRRNSPVIRPVRHTINGDLPAPMLRIVKSPGKGEVRILPTQQNRR